MSARTDNPYKRKLEDRLETLETEVKRLKEENKVLNHKLLIVDKVNEFTFIEIGKIFFNKLQEQRDKLAKENQKAQQDIVKLREQLKTVIEVLHRVKTP